MSQSKAEALRKTVQVIAVHLNKLDDSAASKKILQDKWSIKEILGHLIDSAYNNHLRIIKSLQYTPLQIDAYQQDNWVQYNAYQERKWETIIVLWLSCNEHLASLLKSIPSSQLSNVITTADQESFTLGFLIQDYIKHLVHHCQQILPNIDLKAELNFII